MELFKDVNELKELMDKLMLQTMELIEEDVTLKINIEKLTNEGALLMAKTRFVMILLFCRQRSLLMAKQP